MVNIGFSLFLGFRVIFLFFSEDRGVFYCEFGVGWVWSFSVILRIYSIVKKKDLITFILCRMLGFVLVV